MKRAERVFNGINRVLLMLGAVLSGIMIPILIINCTLLVKSFTNKNEIPSFFGMMPLIVLTDSMSPQIQSGDVILCKTIDAEDVRQGDVISFYDPMSANSAVVTHQVIEIIEEDGSLSFRTKGINNNTEDRVTVPASNVIARYTGTRFPGAGDIAIFMQSATGILVCVVLPLVLFIGYDILRRRIYNYRHGEDVEALKAELEALKEEKT